MVLRACSTHAPIPVAAKVYRSIDSFHKIESLSGREGRCIPHIADVKVGNHAEQALPLLRSNLFLSDLWS